MKYFTFLDDSFGGACIDLEVAPSDETDRIRMNGLLKVSLDRFSIHFREV